MERYCLYCRPPAACSVAILGRVLAAGGGGVIADMPLQACREITWFRPNSTTKCHLATSNDI